MSEGRKRFWQMFNLSQMMRRIGHQWGPWMSVDLLGKIRWNLSPWSEKADEGIVTRRVCYRCGKVEDFLKEQR